MYVKELTYTDFDGNERTEEFRFNLTLQEVTNMQLSTVGGLDAYIKKISAEQDIPKTIKLFQELIDLSYGIKSPDGKKFVKTKEALEDFKATQAYSDFYMSLINDVKAATDFVNGITPPAPQDHKQSEKVTPINK